MRNGIIIAVIFILASTTGCRNSRPTDERTYRARLEIKGICLNYTIKLLEPLDTSLVQQQWTDEHTGKAYTNVFGLESICNFPADLNEGDEFSFRLDPNASRECARCLAYYPTPDKKLSIKVISTGK